MSWQVQETINVGNRDPLWTIGNFHDVVEDQDFAFACYKKEKLGQAITSAAFAMGTKGL